MAGLNNDYIQQQLLEQSIAMNDNLSAMRQLLLDANKNKSGSGNSGSNNNSRRPPKKEDKNTFKNAFKDLFGEAKNMGKVALGNNGSIQNTVGSFVTSAKVLETSLGKLPGPVGVAATAFLKIVEVGGMVYDYLNDQLNMYNQLNSAGLNLASGMLTVRKGSSGAFMSINEFSSAIQRNSDALAAMDGQYGDGVEHFGKLLNTVQLAQDKMGLYGVSQQQLADITAKNYKFEKMYAGQRQIRTMSESQSTEKFVGSMTYLSKAVGKSVDELMARFSDLSNNIDTGATIDALQRRFGLDENTAIETSKSMNAMFASLGEFGKTAQQINAANISVGSLPEEFNDNVSHMFADFMGGIQKSGITDQRTINRMTAQFVKDHERMILDQADTDRQLGNSAAEAFHRQMLQTMKVLNDPKNNPSPIIENFTNRFNLWIGKTFTEPFNKFYAETAEKAASYLMNLADNSTDAWDFMSKLTSDAFNNFTSGMLGPFGALTEIPGKLMQAIFGDSWNKVSESFSNLAGDILQIPIRIGKLIWNMFTGSEDEIDQSGKEMMGSIKKVFSSVLNVFTNIGSLEINFDDVKKKFDDAISSLKNKLTSMWDRVSSWWNDSEETPTESPKPIANNKPTNPLSTEPQTAGIQKVTSPPEITKPIKIEQADQTTPEQQQVAKSSNDEDTKKLLQSILNNLESQGQNNSQLAIILRQIADNTEPPRNV